MTHTAPSPEAFVEALPEDRQAPVTRLRNTIKENLPQGFEEVVASGMINYVVPHALYPAGYHCNPHQPLPFLSLASQKSHIALYHMGLYMDAGLMEWFTQEWAAATASKLDMGKSCIRFKKPENIPYEVIGKLVSRVTPQQWISRYTSFLKK